MAEAGARIHSMDHHDIELRVAGELERLPGVVSAAIWLDSHGHLRDSRIQIMPGAAPSIITNAASRVLQSQRIPFDPRAIRLTNVAVPDEVQNLSIAATASGGGRFLLLHDITAARSGAHVTCRVQLMCQDTLLSGETRELDTAAGRVRAAAAATLRAAENSSEGLALGLEAAVIAPFFGRNYAVVSVEASVGRRVATLSGLVPADPARAIEESVCLATLRAIDRWVAL